MTPIFLPTNSGHKRSSGWRRWAAFDGLKGTNVSKSQRHHTKLQLLRGFCWAGLVAMLGLFIIASTYRLGRDVFVAREAQNILAGGSGEAFIKTLDFNVLGQETRREMRSDFIRGTGTLDSPIEFGRSRYEAFRGDELALLVTFEAGRFVPGSATVHAVGEVFVESTRGYRIKARDVFIDMLEESLRSDQAVSFVTREGFQVASENGFETLDFGQNISLRGSSIVTSPSQGLAVERLLF